jgi:hypothetical protein
MRGIIVLRLTRSRLRAVGELGERSVHGSVTFNLTLRAALPTRQHQPNHSLRPRSLRIIEADSGEMPEQSSELSPIGVGSGGLSRDATLLRKCAASAEPLPLQLN